MTPTKEQTMDITLRPAPFTAHGHTYDCQDVIVDGTVVGQITRSANGCFAMGRVEGGEWCGCNHGRTEDAVRCATRNVATWSRNDGRTATVNVLHRDEAEQVALIESPEGVSYLVRLDALA